MKSVLSEGRIPKNLQVDQRSEFYTLLKGYTPNYTTEIFEIERVAPTNPVTYLLRDYKNEPISGGFYEQEIARVKYPDVYLVEKVLKRRKNQIYVKWLGFDNSHNSWIEKE